MKGKVEKAKVVGVSVGADGTTWCCDSAGFLYRHHENHWYRDGEARAVEVAVGSAAHIWCRNEEGSAFQLQSNGKWKKDDVARNVATISVGSDGTVWAGNTSGKAIKATGLNQWSKENPDASDVVEVTVGGANNVWCRNGSGKVFKLKSSSSDSGWDEDTVVSLVGSIAAGSDGTVWLTNTDPGNRYRLFKLEGQDRAGRNRWSDANPQGRATQVAVGKASEVYCVNDKGQIFRLNGTAWNSGWDPVSQPSTPTVYVVQSGDTLGDIVQSHFQLHGAALNQKISEVAAQSQIGNADDINVGDVIVLDLH